MEFGIAWTPWAQPVRVSAIRKAIVNHTRAKLLYPEARKSLGDLILFINQVYRQFDFVVLSLGSAVD